MRATRASRGRQVPGRGQPTLTLPQLAWAVLASHDFSPRQDPEAGAPALKRAFEVIRSESNDAAVLFWTYAISSFFYSVIGVAMLAYWNAKLPARYVETASIPLDLYSWLLVVQGPVSFAADVWARALRGKLQHVFYAADRILATSMTILTFHLGLVCWWPNSSPMQQQIASATLFGLVPFALSQRALRRGRYRAFMALHIGWHVSIPSVALAWLGHTASAWFAS